MRASEADDNGPLRASAVSHRPSGVTGQAGVEIDMTDRTGEGVAVDSQVERP